MTVNGTPCSGPARRAGRVGLARRGERAVAVDLHDGVDARVDRPRSGAGAPRPPRCDDNSRGGDRLGEPGRGQAGHVGHGPILPELGGDCHRGEPHRRGVRSSTPGRRRPGWAWRRRHGSLGRMLLLATPPATPRRERLARLERPLLLAGLALVALHLLDLAFSGAATSPLAILGIVALPAGLGGAAAAHDPPDADRARGAGRAPGGRLRRDLPRPARRASGARTATTSRACSSSRAGWRCSRRRSSPPRRRAGRGARCGACARSCGPAGRSSA